MFQLGLALDALPPLPCYIAPLKVAKRLSEFLCEWWQAADEAVPLAEAFRLLSAEVVTGVVLRAMTEIETTDLKEGERVVSETAAIISENRTATHLS